MQACIRAGLAALGYFASARLGYALAIPGGIVTLWPPSGLMLAILLLSRRQHWPALVAGGLAGSVASDLLTGYTPGLALAAALANGCETVVAAWVLQAWRGPNVSLSDLRGVIGFVLGAVVAANGATAMLGALTLHAPFGRAWLIWWLGDGVGMLIVAPVILGWVDAFRRRQTIPPQSVVEALALTGVLAATAWMALGPRHAWLLNIGPYAVFPLLFWAGLRFGPVGAATGMAVVAYVAVAQAARATGPFAAGATGESVAVQTYVYLFVASLASLIPAAVLEERQSARRAVAESERRYRSLFESNPQPTWVYDLETLAFLAVNDAAVKRYGYTREEFLQRTLLDIRPPEDVPRLHRWREEAVHRPLHRHIWRHRTRDGTVMDVEVNSHAIEFAGRPARVLQAIDLTEQRRAEESLRATRERLQHVIASSGAVLFEMPLGERDRLEWVSENVTAVLGYTVETALAPEWWIANLHPDDRERAADRSGTDPAHVGFTEYRLRHADGRYRWIREERRLRRDDRDRPVSVVGTWIDVTHWRELESQFRQSQKLEAVGRLAGSVAHDFNNLLTVILGEAEMVIDSLSTRDEAQRRPLEAIRAAAKRAALLTRQLLVFSRRQLVAPSRVNLTDVVTDVDRMLQRLIGEDVRVVLRLEPGLRQTMADRGQIEQLLVNLIVNARDAMPHGGVLTVATANVDVDAAGAAPHPGAAPGRYVLLAVSDNGTGMSEEVKQHLFEPFFTTKEPGKGTGLGLATCDAIARQSGGWITADSEIGIGTTIKVYFPALIPGPEAFAEPSQALVRGGTETILLVEDERDVRRVAVRALRELGYHVHEAEDGLEAVAFLETHPDRVDLLLTDVVLPRLGGREAADRALQLRPGLRVLFASGYSADLVLRGRLLGHEVALLQKPFTAETLALKVREVLDGPSPAGRAG